MAICKRQIPRPVEICPVVAAGADVVTDLTGNGLVHVRPRFGAQPIFPQEPVNGLRGFGRYKLAFGVRASILLGASDVHLMYTGRGAFSAITMCGRMSAHMRLRTAITARSVAVRATRAPSSD
jgi:hypothetical protein